MERIRNAVEKAKEAISRKPAPAVGGESVSPAITPARRGDQLTPAVEYLQTRVFEPDPDVLERNRIVAMSKSSHHSVYFDILRTQVLSKMEENGWRTLAVVSPTPESGKTMVAINLAYSIAHDSKRTAMLIDFDLRRPRVAEYLGIPLQTSLNDVLAGAASLADALVNPSLPGLVILPTASRVSKSAEMLGSQRIADLVSEVRERYSERIIVFDLPPLLVTDDAISVLPQIDCVLMVVGNGMVTKAEVDESLRHLNARNLLGVVLNMGDVQTRDDYYY